MNRFPVLALPLLAVLLPSSAVCQDARTEPSFEDLVESYADAEATEEDCGEVEMDLVVDAFRVWPELGHALVHLSEEPTDATRHFRVGNMYAHAGAQHLALVSFQCATRLDRRFVAAWNNVGVLHLSRREFDLAADALIRATRLDPTYARAYYNLGMVYDEMHRYDQALESYETAVKLDPRLAEARYNPQAVKNPHRVAIFLKRLLEDRAVVSGGLDDRR